jgi:hypothetical protein
MRLRSAEWQFLTDVSAQLLGLVSRFTKCWISWKIGKTCNPGTTENSHIERCTHTAESSDVKLQNIEYEKKDEKKHYMGLKL